MSKWPTREEAEKILDEWVANGNLKKHAWAVEAAKTMPKDAIIVVNLSGRGDKDMHTVAKALGVSL